MQRNLNAGLPLVSICRIKDSITKKPENVRNDENTINYQKNVCNEESITKNQKNLCNDENITNDQDLYNMESLENIQRVKHGYDEKQSISLSDGNSTIFTNILPISDTNPNESLDSLSKIINDMLSYSDIEMDCTRDIQQLSSNICVEDLDHSKLCDIAQNDNNTFQLEKCHISSDIKIDEAFNIIKKGNNFIIKRKQTRVKENDNISILDHLHYDNANSKINTEPLLSPNKSIQHASINTNINIKDISNSSKFDSTYEPSQSSITCESLVVDNNNKTFNNNNIDSSNNTENNADISTQNKSDYLYIAETLNVQPSACNDNKMFVASSQGRSGAGKNNFCLYCKTFQSKICRHLERIHKDEEDVQKFINLPKGTKERKRIIDTIRRNGNFLFNTNIQFNDGELIVCRRPSQKVSRTAQDFQACINCKGFFSKATLRHHFRYCVGRSKKRNRSVMVLGRSITCRIHEAANPMLAKVVFPVLREDNITRLIRYDELLIKYANKLCDKYKLQHQHDMIRSRLRLLGRFLNSLRAINSSVDDFTSLYNPKYYDDIIKAVNEVAGLNSRTNCYKTPSNATNLGTLLKQVGNTLITECIKKSDNSKKQVTEDLLKLLKEDYSASISRTALETQSRQKRQRKDLLPTTEDVSKLYNYLNEIRRSNYEKLKKKFSYDVWLTLAKAILVTVLVFNRRRAGETERILVEEFYNRQAIDEKTNSELFGSLSASNKKIAKKYVRFTIRGKKNRDVPVLLDSDLTQHILLLLEHRRSAKIHCKNPYLFALPGKNTNRFKFLRACILLREFSEQCGAKLPSSLRGTKLRKHIATKCILLNLQNDEVTDLANYMGHAENIHKEYYRQPIISRDILRMSQLLEKAQILDNANKEENSDSDITEESENNDTENIPSNAQSLNVNNNDSYRVNSFNLHDASEPTDTSNQSVNDAKVIRKRSSKFTKNVSL